MGDLEEVFADMDRKYLFEVLDGINLDAINTADLFFAPADMREPPPTPGRGLEKYAAVRVVRDPNLIDPRPRPKPGTRIVMDLPLPPVGVSEKKKEAEPEEPPKSAVVAEEHSAKAADISESVPQMAAVAVTAQQHKRPNENHDQRRRKKNKNKRKFRECQGREKWPGVE